MTEKRDIPGAIFAFSGAKRFCAEVPVIVAKECHPGVEMLLYNESVLAIGW